MGSFWVGLELCGAATEDGVSRVSGVRLGLSETGGAWGDPGFCGARRDPWALSFTVGASDTGNAGLGPGFCAAGLADGISAGDKEVGDVLEPGGSGV